MEICLKQCNETWDYRKGSSSAREIRLHWISYTRIRFGSQQQSYCPTGSLFWTREEAWPMVHLRTFVAMPMFSPVTWNDEGNTLAEPLLSVSHLMAAYGNTTVIKGLDFEVYEGEIVGLVGPNGAGKTTFARDHAN